MYLDQFISGNIAVYNLVCCFFIVNSQIILGNILTLKFPKASQNQTDFQINSGNFKGIIKI